VRGNTDELERGITERGRVSNSLAALQSTGIELDRLCGVYAAQQDALARMVAMAIQRIFESYVYKEIDMRAVATDLNSDGIPSARGGTWSSSSIRSITVNPIYYGANGWNVRNFSKYHAIESGAPRPHEEDVHGLRFNDPEH
jgi:hypothetical protein